MAAKKRDYKKEYANYHSKPAQKKKRASRNAARATMVKAGKAKKGDGKDVAHKNGNAKDNRKSNLTVQSKSKNRSYARTKTARKKNARD
jgi:hypothetical protein